jgi:hypothetical protein
MAIQQSSFFCPVCQQQRLFTSQKGVNHILHLLVTLFSCGLWAFVWFILTVSDTPRFHCSQCGHSDATKYLANPYLRSQEAQQNAERAALRAESSGLSAWFSGLSSQSKRYLIYLAVVGVLLAVGLGTVVKFETRRRPLNTHSDANSTANSSSNTATPTPMKHARLPSSLSPAENLEEAKQYLSEDTKGGRALASFHLSAIPKTAKEYPVAKQLLAQIKADVKRNEQRNEPSTRKEIEDELAGLAAEDAQLEKTLDLYEDYDGPATTQTKLKALQRKGQIELRRVELEKRLKRIR